MKTVAKVCGAAAISLMLAACGGGDELVAANPSGYWGTASDSGLSMSLLVTEQHEAWGFYLKDSAGGLIQGAGSVAGDIFTATGKDYGADAMGSNAVLSAVVVDQTSQKGRVTGVISADFSLQYRPSYDQAPDMVLAAQEWLLRDNLGDFMSITIGSDASIIGHSPFGSADPCEFSGQLIPHASKNYFTAEVTFGDSAACVLPKQTAKGIVVVEKDPEDDGYDSLMLVLTNADKSVGIGALGLTMN